MRYYLLCLLLGLIIFQTKAQNFASKKLTIYKVYNNLVNSYARIKTPPELQLLSFHKTDTIIAMYYSKPVPTIKIDESLFDICVQMGGDSLNALSVILSHELAHYFYDHNFCSDFAFAVRNTSLGNELKTHFNEFSVENEVNADNAGLYHACIAGYKPFGVFEKLIERIYHFYSIPDKITGYPSKEERVLIGKNAQIQVNKLYNEFLKGKKAIKDKEYLLAIKCFDEINIYFPSRENYNNIGVAKTYLGINLMSKNIRDSSFVYPISFDSVSRTALYHKREKIFGAQNHDSSFHWKKILLEAEQNFTRAIILSPDYILPHINLACVYDLLNNPDAAIGEIKKLPVNQQNSLESYKILAIAYEHLNNSTKSKEFDEKARSLRK